MGAHPFVVLAVCIVSLGDTHPVVPSTPGSMHGQAWMTAGGCPNKCSSRGWCSPSGKCDCDRGWKGVDCSSQTCKNGCSGHGQCEDGSCICTLGWQGDACDEDTCPEHCSGHGKCSFGKCLCNKGFRGEDCSIAVKGCPTASPPDDCSGTGKCVDQVCVCEVGWKGPDCSEDTCPGGRSGDSCSGKGKCKSGVCECFEGWTGKDCCTPNCQNNCNGHGDCKWSVERHFYCVCHKGYKDYQYQSIQSVYPFKNNTFQPCAIEIGGPFDNNWVSKDQRPEDDVDDLLSPSPSPGASPSPSPGASPGASPRPRASHADQATKSGMAMWEDREDSLEENA